MTRTPCILHVANDEDALSAFAHAFAQSGLQAQLLNVAGTADVFGFLSRLESRLHSPRLKLIVIEARRPEQYVWYLLKTLKGNPRLRGIPVVVMTEDERYIDVLRCSAMPCDDFVIRPLELQGLIEAISSFDHWLLGSSDGLRLLPT